MKLAELRAQVPILSSVQDEVPLVYLDNAATSQKPRRVIDALDRYYSEQNANIHRSPHRLGQRATERYEAVRGSIKRLFNASSYEVVFTRGATEALNLVISGVARSREGAIVTSVIDHHSSFVACQQHALRHGRGFRVLDVENGFSGLGRIEGASLVSVPMVSNVTGEVLDYREIADRARQAGAVSLLDAAQAAPHLLLDCDAIGADAYAFSAHKMLGPTGLGVLIARKELLESIEPMLFGGEMVGTVSVERTTFAAIPHRFEAGTMPIAQAIAFGEAIAILDALDRAELERHRIALSSRLLDGLARLDVRVLSAFDDPRSADRVPTASIVGSFHSYDLGLLLDARGIAVRSGHHCAEPFHTSRDVTGSLRASAYLYTTEAEIDAYLSALASML